MGQQQLLLLVLGIVIVGLAVVVGIQAFGENQKKANSDALVNDAVRIASDAQAWNLKPAAFGGGAGAFTNISFEQLGYETSNSIYVNLNGKFQISGVGPATMTITGCDEQANFDNQVQAVVTGTAPESITTTVSSAACGF